MNTTPNGKATESDDVSIVPADEKHAHAYEQTAAAEYQITRADEQRVTKYTSDPKAIETNDAWIARTDERLAHAYEQFARDREQLAWITEQLSRLEHDAGRNRWAVLDRRPLRGGRSTWPHRLAVGSVHFCRGLRVAVVLWWRSQADHCQMGATARFDGIAAA